MIQACTEVILYDPRVWPSSQEHLYDDEDAPAADTTDSLEGKMFRVQCNECDGCPSVHDHAQAIKHRLDIDKTALMAVYELMFEDE